MEVAHKYYALGILSILDYELDDRPNESVAGFDLSNVNVKTHSETTNLVDASVILRVCV